MVLVSMSTAMQHENKTGAGQDAQGAPGGVGQEGRGEHGSLGDLAVCVPRDSEESRQDLHLPPP